MDDTEVKLSFKNSVTGEKNLEKYDKDLEKIYSLTAGFQSGTMQKEILNVGTTSTKTANTTNRNIKTINNNLNETLKSLRSMSKHFDKGFSIASIISGTRTLGNFTKKLFDMANASSSFIENINFLEVAYSNTEEPIEESSRRIEKFINKMGEVYGLDESDLARKFGIFKQIANVMQLPTETAENLCEHLAKMTNDIASLYNLDLNRHQMLYNLHYQYK